MKNSLQRDHHLLLGITLDSGPFMLSKNISYAKSALNMCLRYKATQLTFFSHLKKHYELQYNECMKAKKSVINLPH